MPAEGLHEVEVELRRVVDRLDSLPLNRAATAAQPCRDTARFILERTRELTDGIPAGATLPSLGPQGLGSLIAVLGRDYLAAARRAPHADPSAVLDRLAQLRRALP